MAEHNERFCHSEDGEVLTEMTRHLPGTASFLAHAEVNSVNFLISRAKHAMNHRAATDQISPRGSKFAGDHRLVDWIRVFISEDHISNCEAAVLVPLLRLQ
jgi:hypothetical protein